MLIKKQGEFDIALAYYSLAIGQCQDRFDLLIRSYKGISLVYLFRCSSYKTCIEISNKSVENTTRS